jgi:hypothetical protein
MRLWKKLLMAGIACGAIFGIYFIQQHHSMVQHQLARKSDEPQRLTALETQRPTERETQQQADELTTSRQAATLENERQAALETQRVDSGAKCNGIKRSGFSRLCQAQQGWPGAGF